MSTVKLKVIRVVGAAIFNDEGKCLATRRAAHVSTPLKWEFPGGKLEPGETPQQALAREIKEELTLDVEVGEYISMGIAPQSKNVQIRLDVYHARLKGGQLTLSDHDQYKWCTREELAELDWAAADIPIVEAMVGRSLL